ncbi:MAG TPA: hypothetical protein VFI42_02050 [Thermomicrobiaceae bacterium]|nr:hypothetical protein [Thermomicrobiaceae bacterium]
MDQACFAIPVLPGKSEDARAFFTELEGARRSQYAASERRIGVTTESWYLQSTPASDLLLAYIESPSIREALGTFAQSQDVFDQWFKRRLAEVTGVDLNNPPPWPFSEQLSSYSNVEAPISS